MARQRPGDQEAHRAWARAMSYLRRRWMVPAANISSWRTSTMRPLMSPACAVELLRRAAAEIDHLGREAVRAAWRCVRTSGWHGGDRAVGQAQGRRLRAASRRRARGSSGRHWPATAARTRSRSSAKARFSLSVPASRAAAIADVVEVAPQAGGRRRARRRVAGVEHRRASLIESCRACRRAVRGRLGQHRGLAVAAMEDADLVEDGRLERPRDEAQMAEAVGRQRIDERPAGAAADQAAQAGEEFGLDHRR